MNRTGYWWAKRKVPKGNNYKTDIEIIEVREGKHKGHKYNWVWRMGSEVMLHIRDWDLIEKVPKLKRRD